eukprot:scaffold127021_cov63-Phaeocystis_antarctica.AAC.4
MYASAAAAAATQSSTRRKSKPPNSMNERNPSLSYALSRSSSSSRSKGAGRLRARRAPPPPTVARRHCSHAAPRAARPRCAAAQSAPPARQTTKTRAYRAGSS